MLNYKLETEKILQLWDKRKSSTCVAQEVKRDTRGILFKSDSDEIATVEDNRTSTIRHPGSINRYKA